ncbi:MAG: hypothetical protein NVSMB57_14660 [Actinomycetota bacterium]
MEIRPIRAEEISAAGEVAVAGFAEFYKEDLGYYAGRLRDVASRIQGGEVLVAVEDGTVAGTVTYIGNFDSPFAEKMDAGEAGIRMLAVHPRFMRRGIGRALSQACIERARSEGKDAIVLHADEIMKISQSLYESLGFVRDPERDYAPDDTTFLIAYRLPLRNPKAGE